MLVIYQFYLRAICFVEKEFIMNIHLEDLRNHYLNKEVVPFIGAGLSSPFKVPTWGGLIRSIADQVAVGKLSFVKEAVDFELDKNDYWRAIEALMNYCTLNEHYIQKQVASLIKVNQITLNDNSLHNYHDLSNMNFDLFLTTNYENLLQSYLQFDNQPILLKDILFNTQDLFKEKRVCQLHGTTSNSGTIVLSRKSYLDLYENKKYDDLLKLVTGSKKLLFLGFSFDDQFIKTLIQEHKSSFNGDHYILLDSPSNDKVHELSSQYGLNTISYSSQASSHSEEIRKILNYISTPLLDEGSKKGTNNEQRKSTFIMGAGLKAQKQDLKGNLFYKKLRLENISPNLIVLSSAFYVAADEYIRQMKHQGMSLEIIDYILGQVFIEYTEIFDDTYSKHGDSEVFLKAVHDSLKEIDYGRHKEFLYENTTNKNENRGFIHMLADDEKEKVWWGKERLNETRKGV